MPPTKLLVRVALRLRAIYLARAVQVADNALLERLTNYQCALERTRAALRRATADGWTAAGPTIRRHLLSLQKAVRQAVDQTSRELQNPPPRVPDLRSLVEELRQLDGEFGGLQIQLRHKALHVTTESIELKGVTLGPFTIHLGWVKLTSEIGSQSFEIVAEAPNPAAANDSVTHPHVLHGVLCAGDAKVPIQRALEQGRLADAFCLVRSVLTHYNPKSPHVPLEDWGGLACYDCGCSVPADELSGCERCGYDFCSDCSAACNVCEESRCHGCLLTCPICEQWYCPGCQVRNTSTGKPCCRFCLNADTASDSTIATDELEPTPSPCSSSDPDVIEAPMPPAAETDASPHSETPDPENVHESANAVPALA